MYEQHQRQGRGAWVRSDLKGKEWDYSLCRDCRKFEPDAEDKGCEILKTVMDLAALENLVLPVWECGVFEER
ncbi:MAG TPA: hypothetical protein PLI51_10440 [bacterium]|nr:hypothetical protein [bacterium]HPQ67133.1 hypothetical protein [bacterium]